jgi:UDP-N-acetylmuramoyl-tripeptide--D-alanyl-D-alanine ligase
VTRVAPAHLEFFGDVDTVEREKGRLVEALPVGGLAVLNTEDPRVLRMRQRTRARVATYGVSPEADVRAERVKPLGFDGVRFDLLHRDARVSVTLPLTGAHFVTCALAAAAAALEEGVTLEAVKHGLERPLANRRLEPLVLPGGVTLLDDTYNASPEAMRAALDVLAACNGRRIAVLGDMFELGAAGPPAHREVGVYTHRRADLLLAVGDLGRDIAGGAQAAGLQRTEWYATPLEAADALKAHLQPGDFVLIKGSRGMRLDSIVAAVAGEHLPSGRGAH